LNVKYNKKNNSNPSYFPKGYILKFVVKKVKLLLFYPSHYYVTNNINYKTNDRFKFNKT